MSSEAEDVARLLLRMTQAELGRVEILHGDYHQSAVTGRPAIRQQLAELIALHKSNPAPARESSN